MSNAEAVVATRSVPPIRPFAGLFDLVSAAPIQGERAGDAHTLQLALRAFAVSLGFSALYGAAAGCTSPTLVWQDPLKLPMILILSIGCSLPIGALAWKVLGERSRFADLLMSTATGVFTAMLVLACGSPLIALYYLTTEHVGGVLVALFVTSATFAGIANGLRAGLRRREPDTAILPVVVPMMVMTGALLAALVQLVHLASPIIPEQTVLDGGIESILRMPR